VSPLYFTIPASTTASACRSCGVRVFWISTAQGVKMPVEVDAQHPNFPQCREPQPVEPGLGFSHFVTCPNANAHRKKGRSRDQ
jgi:hypothetical protein